MIAHEAVIDSFKAGGYVVMLFIIRIVKKKKTVENDCVKQ